MPSANELQAIQNKWEKGLIPEEARTPEIKFARLVKEWEELVEAMGAYNGENDTARNAAEELADVFIIGLGLFDALGFDAETMILEKYAVNYEKYGVERNGKLKAEGYDWETTLQIQKSEWSIEK